MQKKAREHHARWPFLRQKESMFFVRGASADVNNYFEEMRKFIECSHFAGMLNHPAGGLHIHLFDVVCACMLNHPAGGLHNCITRNLPIDMLNHPAGGSRQR